MQDYMLWFWIALFVLFLIAEALTAQLTTIWFACGALVALLLDIAGVDSIAVQIVAFALVSVIVLVATRPLVKKVINKRQEATNADRNISADAVVTQQINNLEGTGSVKIGPNIWTARSLDGTVIEEGSIVVVEKIEGVKAIVSKKS